MKRRIILGSFVIGLMGFAGTAIAQRGKGSSASPESTPMGVPHMGATAGDNFQDFLLGVVKDVSKDELVLTKTQAGTDQYFKFTKKTKFVLDGKSSSLESVHTGDKVWVDVYEDKKTGELFARKVVAGVFVMKQN